MVDHTLENVFLSYKKIKNHLLKINFPDEEIESLKVFFSREINSKRKQSTTENIGELIKVLEERCFLHCLDIEPLFKIETKANCEVLKTMLSCHLKLLGDICTRSQRELVDEPLVKESCSSLRVEIPKSVIKLISQNIGFSWKDFARCLKLREIDIDNIEEYYSKDSDRGKKVLHMFEQDALYSTYKTVILSALTKISRKALMEKVDKEFGQL